MTILLSQLVHFTFVLLIVNTNIRIETIPELNKENTFVFISQYITELYDSNESINFLGNVKVFLLKCVQLYIKPDNNYNYTNESNELQQKNNKMNNTLYVCR